MGAWAVTLAAPLLVLGLVTTYAVDVPRWDEWEYTHFLLEAARGEATVADLFAQYNESRVAVGRLVLLGFAVFTNWNLRAQSLVAPALAAMTLLLVGAVGRASLGERSSWTAALAVSSLLVFSPAQDDNWMMPLQFIAFIPGVCLAAVLWLGTREWRWSLRWGAAILLCVIATFSVPSGLVLWGLGWAALWWPPSATRNEGRIAGMALWIAAACLTVAFFFRGFVTIGTHGEAVTPVSDASRFSTYIVAFLGGPFSRGTAFSAIDVAPWAGAVLLLVFVAAVAHALQKPSLRRRAVPWILWGGFGLAQAVAGAALRSRAGLLQALPSRYATFALTLPLAAVWLVALAASDHARTGRLLPPRAVAFGAGTVATALTLLALSGGQAIREMQRLSTSLLSARAALPFAGHVVDMTPLALLYPRPDLLPTLAAPLWARGWLRPPRRADASLPGAGDDPEPGRAGWIERASRGDGTLTLEGWALVPTTERPADLIAIAWHGTDGPGHVFAFNSTASEPRDYLGPPGDPRRRSGWLAVVHAEKIPAGAQRLTAWAVDGQSGRAFRLHGEHVLARPSAGAPAASQTESVASHD